MAGVQPSDAEVGRPSRVRVTSTPTRSGTSGCPASPPPTPTHVRDVPPPTWGLEPTPRDQAAIDAGNA